MKSVECRTVKKIESGSRTIQLRMWAPQTQPKQVLILSHGMGEHIDRYQGFAQFAVEKSLAVIGANHRGHGDDAALLGHFDDEEGWNKVLQDLDCIVTFAKQNFDCPVILAGHSMGSFVARHYAILHADKLSGLVLCGSDYQTSSLYKVARLIAQSQVKLFNKRYPSALLEILAFAPFSLKVKKRRTVMDWLNRVDEEVDKYIADPLCGFRSTAQFWVDFMTGLAWSSQPNNLAKISSELPIFVASGDGDPVSRMGKGAKDLQQALKNSGVKRVDLTLYPGARHELFLELNRQEFYDDLLHWVDEISHQQ